MGSNGEYVSSATLIVIGDDLDPDDVSRELSLIPSDSWRKGERRSFVRQDGTRHVFESRYEWGGWKMRVSAEHDNDPLEAQLQFWVETLQDKKPALARLKSAGMQCILDLFVATNIARIILTEGLQKSVASLGLEIELTISTGYREEVDDSEQTVADMEPRF
jgi:hypothetical protein